MSKKRIVIIGGGHGQAAICRAIKNIEGLDIRAIVTVADDGGSTGRLRKQFHIPAMGDIRNVMIALAESESLMSELMDYRFEDKDGSQEDVAGHNLGNLILTAMTKQYGSFLEAISKAGNILNVKGTIIPATTEVITLFAKMEDGTIVQGEANIPRASTRIKEVYYEKEVHATPQAIEAIEKADYVLYGIGSVYTSILPNVIIPEIKDALYNTKAKCIYVCNAMTQFGETDDYGVEDHVRALRNHGCPLSSVLLASDTLPEEVIEKYAKEGAHPVVCKEDEHDYEVVQEELLSISQGLVRHDAKKLELAIRKMIQE